MRPLPVAPPIATWRPLIERALAEDVGPGDLTSELVIPRNATGHARIEAREELVVSGLPMVKDVFHLVDPTLECTLEEPEAKRVESGAPLMRLHGSLQAILKGERTALNLLARLCGISTLTRRYVEATDGTDVQVVDTRKTLPGWRYLDKYASRGRRCKEPPHWSVRRDPHQGQSYRCGRQCENSSGGGTRGRPFGISVCR